MTDEDPPSIAWQPLWLTELIVSGERLASSAAMVGDQDDFHAWRSKRNAWIADVSAALNRSMSVTGGAASFREAVTVRRPLTGWRVGLEMELGSVQNALALLRELP